MFPELLGPSLVWSSAPPDTGERLSGFSRLYRSVLLDTPSLGHVLLPLVHLCALWMSTIGDFLRRNEEELSVVRASGVQDVGDYGVSGARFNHHPGK